MASVVAANGWSKRYAYTTSRSAMRSGMCYYTMHHDVIRVSLVCLLRYERSNQGQGASTTVGGLARTSFHPGKCSTSNLLYWFSQPGLTVEHSL